MEDTQEVKVWAAIESDGWEESWIVAIGDSLEVTERAVEKYVRKWAKTKYDLDDIGLTREPTSDAWIGGTWWCYDIGNYPHLFYTSLLIRFREYDLLTGETVELVEPLDEYGRSPSERKRSQ
jgi:hypothetical protein